jgi:DNA-binding LacI/PurR family transcriptional regulator
VTSESAGIRTTLAEVARLAGTSVPTVSKVLRGGTDISPTTRKRVMEAVQATGYHRRGKSGHPVPAEGPTMIDLVVNHVEGSWANRVLSGVEAEAAAADVDVVISMATNNRDWVSRLLRRPSAGAVVVLVDPTSSQFQALSAAQVPVVLIDPMTKPTSEVPSVGVANWDGGRLAAEHLAEQGHRHVGVIAGARTHVYSRARIDGFRSAMEAMNAEGTVAIGYGDWDRAQARAASLAMLQRQPQITAVFACSDVMALGVYDALADLGLTVPERVSVVGFDDVPEAQWARPPLTTIRQPSVEMGAAAVRMLLGSIGGVDGSFPTSTRIEMATSLVVRESTSRPASATR